MVRVIPINLAYNPRALWFDPGELEVAAQDAVVVQTARGIEFGRAADEPFEVEERQVKALKSPLQPVLRLATEEDVEAAAEMERRAREALPYFKELAAEVNQDMRPVCVEFLLDGDKAVFYFEAEERVDFRELVRRLASHFHVRIDMRQIGVRDEARMVGGLGHCGQVLCCKRMGGEFCPVSIRMAKEQDLSLNPQKISGVCGRLMCCLRYEYEAYKDFKQRAPKAGSKVRTPEGDAKVVELDVLRETVKLAPEEGKPVVVPLASFEPVAEGKRPNAVGEEAWEEAQHAEERSRHGDAFAFATSQFTGTDKLAEAGAVRRTPGSRRREDEEARGRKRDEGGSRRSRSRRRKGSAEGAAPEAKPARKPRRRRSTTISAEGEKQSTPANGREEGSSRRSSAPRRSQRSGGQRKEGAKAKGSGPRPGQRSSGLQSAKADGGAKERRDGGQGQPKGQGHRRRRRRSSKPGGDQGQGGSGSGGRGGAQGQGSGGAA